MSAARDQHRSGDQRHGDDAGAGVATERVGGLKRAEPRQPPRVAGQHQQQRQDDTVLTALRKAAPRSPTCSASVALAGGWSATAG